METVHRAGASRYIVMYQKVISADPEILTRNFLRERGNYRMERWTCLVAHRTDYGYVIISRAACARAKSAKSKINPSALGDNRRGRDSWENCAKAGNKQT